MSIGEMSRELCRESSNHHQRKQAEERLYSKPTHHTRNKKTTTQRTMIEPSRCCKAPAARPQTMRHNHSRMLYDSMLLKPSKPALQIVITITVVLLASLLVELATSHQELVEPEKSPAQKQQQQEANREEPVYSYSLPLLNETGVANIQDESESGAQTELDFKLMNAAHDRLQAVRSLLNATRQQMTSSTNIEPDHQRQQEQQSQRRIASATGSSLQCAHKGRQYADGQTVLIEDQPCLNCTCRMAILQCYLRVCPPVVSLEHHKRRLLASGRALPDDQECRMVREASQCCPVMKCGAELVTQNSTGPEARNVIVQAQQQQQQHSPPPPSTIHHELKHQLAQRNAQADNAQHSQLVAGSVSERFEQAQRVGDQEQLQQSASSVIQTTTITPLDNLPKLTVINGPAGQRDSILLITSNPQSISLNAGYHHESTRFRNKSAGNSTNLSTSTGQDQDQRQLVSSAPIIEALLETIYSSAAKQLSGLNLQGSCMINGSLYFEGSAVLPETASAQCQYCYCIRQKVMCVKPRCHLIISGCAPRYSDEFACCPTSYNCQSSGGREASNGTTLARLTSLSSPTLPSSSESLQARLSAVLEAALARVTRNPPASTFMSNSLASNELDPNEPLTPRQIDGGQSATTKLEEPERSLELMLNSILEDRPSESTATQTATTSVPTMSTTTPTTTSTTPAPLRPNTTMTPTSTTTSTTITSTTPEPARQTMTPTTTKACDEEEGDKNDEDVDKGRQQSTARPVESSQPRRATSTEQKRSSVSNFLEPMNKLGPHMNSPTIPSGCIENGRNYAIGEQIPTIEPCKHCYCGPEGLKECKMVECEVKGGHDCRPVTQEGHCCPIRYECPPMSPPTPNNLKVSLDLAAALHECKGANGISNSNCYGDTEAPVLKSVRFIEQDEPGVTSPATSFNGIREPLGQTDLSKLQENSSIGNLTEELNQFIMRIRANQTGAGAQSDEPSAPVEYPTGSNETTRQDYDSVKPPDGSFSVTSGDPLTIPPGMFGIPSIVPETIENLTRNFDSNPERIERQFDIALSPPSLVNTTALSRGGSGIDYVTNNTAGGSRDMRSTNAHMLNNLSDYMTTMVDLGTPQPVFNSTTELDSGAPGIGNVSLDDYIDLSDDQPASQPVRFANQVTPANASEVAHTRSLRDENSATRLRNQTVNSVDFDDDAIMGLINNQHINLSQPVGGGGGSPPSNERIPPSLDSTTDSIYPAVVNSEPADSVTDRPRPDQPTTGTPIGVEAERTLLPNSTSWLRLLPQWTRSFGQRLSGIDSFEGAANGQQHEVVTLVAQNQSLPVGASEQSGQTGRSSRQNPFISMLKSIIASTGEQKQQLEQQAFQPIQSAYRTANLIMRPLEDIAATNQTYSNDDNPSGSSQTAPVQQQRQQQQQTRAKQLGSPYEPSISPSELEIVTAPVPHEPEVFGQTRAPTVDTKDLVVVASSSFARRSDVTGEERDGGKDDQSGDDDKTPIVSGSRTVDSQAGANQDRVVRYFSSLSSAGLNNQLSNGRPADLSNRVIATTDSSHSSSALPRTQTTNSVANLAQRQSALSCLDLATNRTYQLNERIPKLDEPCKACHCILGKEICQPLVCPERPSENCREERRPGECCSDFLCGDGLKPLGEPNVVPPPNQMSNTNVRMLAEPAVGQHHLQAMALPNPKSLIPTQRALGVDQEQSSNGVNKLTRLLASQERQVPMMRTADSASILPSQLRFRSGGMEQQHQQQHHHYHHHHQQQHQQQQSGSNQIHFPQLQQYRQQQANTNHIHMPQVNQNADQRIGALAQSIQQQPHNMRSSSFLPTTSLVRSPILMHPQLFIQQQQQQQQNFLRRNDETGNTQTVGSNPIPFSMGAPNYQFQNNRLDQTNAINEHISTMRLPSSNNVNRFDQPQQVTAAATHLPPPTASMAPGSMSPTSNHMNQNINNNNLTNNWSRNLQTASPHLPPALRTMPLFTNQQNPSMIPQQSAPTSNHIEPMRYPLSFMTTSSSEPPPRAMSSVVDSMQPDKITFKQNQMSLADSTGFRPIVGPAFQAVTPNLGGNKPVKQTVRAKPIHNFSGGESFVPMSTPNPIEASSHSSYGASSRQEPETTTTMTATQPTTTSSTTTSTESPPVRFSQQLTTPSESEAVGGIRSEPEAPVSSSIAPQLNYQQADATLAMRDLPLGEPTSSSVASAGESFSTLTETASTTTTTITTTTASPTYEPDQESSTSSSEDSSLDFFKVSECNIYGRVYKVGQPIEELSNSCKRCTCTSMGVDCQDKC